MADNIEQSSKKVLDIVKEQVKTQAAFNNIIENSVSNLNEVLKKYAKINESNLGLLDISKNLIKAKFEQLKQQRESENLEKSLSDKSKKRATEAFNAINQKTKLEKDYYNAVKKGNNDLAEQALINIQNNDIEIARKTAALKVEEKIYLAQLQANKVSQDSVSTLSSRFTILKGTFNTLKSGVSGLVTGSAKILSSLTGSGSNLFTAGVDFLKMIPGIGGILAGAVGGLKSLLDFILEIEDRTVKFGRALGYSRQESFRIVENFGNLSTGTGELLVTTQNLIEVQTDLSNQLGISNILTNEMLTTQIELKKIMGLSAAEMGSLAQASIISGKSQQDTVEGIVGQVAGLKQATGISFNYKQIIGEVTKLSGVLGLRFAKFPEALTKSALVTKALGMDLAKVDQIAGSLLNFEESIQNQLEAQLITGKNINLSRAQQLALEGDTAGVAVEISKQIGDSNEYLEMNRIQQESIAKAVGMTREDLADTLKNQDMLTKLGAKDTDNAQKRLQLAIARFGTEKEINEALGEGAYQNLTQLSAQEKIAALIDKVKGAFQDFLTKSGVVEWVTGLIQKLTDPNNVKGLINTLKEGVASIADIIQSIAYGILTVANAITFGSNDTIKSMREKIGEESMGDKIRSLGSNQMPVNDFIIKPLNEDTITMAGGTKLGRTDEMVDILKQILQETKQGKSITVSVDGQPLATAVARNASLTPAASNLGPRPLR